MTKLTAGSSTPILYRHRRARQYYAECVTASAAISLERTPNIQIVVPDFNRYAVTPLTTEIPISGDDHDCSSVGIGGLEAPDGFQAMARA